MFPCQASSPSSSFLPYYDSEPPFLAIGTDVSAKYKGAFCEAKIKKVTRLVKCRVTFKNNCGSVIVTDDNVKGPLRIGAHVEARHPDKNQYLEGIINKIIDASQYTVVFDDGDETTLRRTSLCLKSGKHFAESESLDHLPLTNPEHFGNPVNLGVRGGRRRRRRMASGISSANFYSSAFSDVEDNESAEGDIGQGNSGASIDDDDDSASILTQQSGSIGNIKDDSSESEIKNNPDLGKVVYVEYGDKRGTKSKDTWFPALIVSPSAQKSHSKIDSKEDYLVKSFINGRYYQVAKKDVKEFNKKVATALTSENCSTSLKSGVEKALCYLEKDDLPLNWDHDILLGNMASNPNSVGDNVGASSDFDSEDSDEGDDNEPSEEKDRFVAQLYKFMDERGTPINKAPSVVGKDLDLYKLYRLVAKAGGYNRVTNRNMWKKIFTKMNLAANNGEIAPLDNQSINQLKLAYKKYLLSFDDFYRKLGCTMVNNALSSRNSGRLGRSERKWRGSCSEKEKDSNSVKSRRKKSNTTEPEKKDESIKEEPQEKESTVEVQEDDKKTPNGPGPRKGKKRGKIGRKKGSKAETDGEEDASLDMGDEKGFAENMDSESESEAEFDSKTTTISKDVKVEVDDRIRVKYGKGKAVKIYEAKVLKTDNDPDVMKRRYYVHYTGWNVRYDEWIKRTRIVEVVKDKITKRKGSKVRKGIPIGEDGPPSSMTKDAKKEEGSNCGKESKEGKDGREGKDGKDSKEPKTSSGGKRGRPPSSADKSIDSIKASSVKKESKAGGKRRSKGDPSEVRDPPNIEASETNSPSCSSQSAKASNEDESIDNSHLYSEDACQMNETSMEVTQEEEAVADVKEEPKVEESCANIEVVPPVGDNCELEESTDIDGHEISVTTIETSLTSEKHIQNETTEPMKRIITEDLLTCDENLGKSPMRSDSPDQHLNIGIKSGPNEQGKNDIVSDCEANMGETPTDNDEEEPGKSSSTKRKQISKSASKKDKDRKRGRSSDVEEEEKDKDDEIAVKKKKPRKKPEESAVSEEGSKKPIKVGKKKRKSPIFPETGDAIKDDSSSTANTSTTITLTNDIDALTKGKKRRRTFNKSKLNELAGKSLQHPTASSVDHDKPREPIAPKKRIKKEVNEKKKKERDKEKVRERDKEIEMEKEKPKEVSRVNEEGNENLNEKEKQYNFLMETERDSEMKQENEKDEEKDKHKDKEDRGNHDDDHDQDEDENQEIASLFKIQPPAPTDEHMKNDMSSGEGLQEVGGSFLLCKEEVPASPPGHQMENIVETIRNLPPAVAPSSSSSSSCVSGEVVIKKVTSSPLQLASHSSSHVQPPSNLPLPEGRHHLEHLSASASTSSSQPNRTDCGQFTPPTTPESLKSGTLSSSSPPHERESSDNEKHQIHIPADQVFPSDMEVSKTTLASAISALDSLANAASGVSAAAIKKCNSSLSPAHISEDSCSRNGLNESTTVTITTSTRGEKMNYIHSPMSSPKKRRGRLRTSSTSESVKESKTTPQTTGCKTRGSYGRKTRQYGESTNETFSTSELFGGPISPAFPLASLSSYSPNAFVLNVHPTSKYNYCTPIDENLEAEKRIQILQERLQDLRKTYLNIKSEVLSLERRRKKTKKKDNKESTSPVSPTSSSLSHSETRNPKDHPPENIGQNSMVQAQSCTA